MVAVGAIGYLAWREFPRVVRLRHTDGSFDGYAAGDVRLDTSTTARAGHISNLPQFVVQYSTSLRFTPGSATLTIRDARLLDNIVSKVQALPGYVFEVAAFSDPSESATASA